MIGRIQQFFLSVTDIRNDMLHLGFRDSPVDGKSLKKNSLEKLRGFTALVDEILACPTV